MGVSYETLKCPNCGSTNFDADMRCLYCGTKIEREERYDGLYTIKNVARQAILDAAFRRMNDASTQVSECEKIASDYIGTVLARICWRMTAVMTPGACRGEEAGGMKQRLMADYRRLHGAGITEDEAGFYSYLQSADSADDAFAGLMVVFDVFGDKKRTEYFLERLRPGAVYSKESNRLLLVYCLREGKLDAAKAITGNTANIDTHTSLETVLEKCPDCPDKAEMAVPLMRSGAFGERDRAKIQKYIAGGDSCAVKAKIVGACAGSPAMPDMEEIIRHVLSGGSAEDILPALQGICSVRLNDDQMYRLLNFALAQPKEKALQVLECMTQSVQYIVLTAAQLQLLFDDPARPAVDRLEIWQAVSGLKLYNRAADTVLARYLCTCADTPEDREQILTVLAGAAEGMPAPEVLENYLTKCTLDGAKKPDILRLLLSGTNSNPAMYPGLAGRYMASAPDDAAVKKAVFDTLRQLGFPLEGGSLTDYICGTEASSADKIETLRGMSRGSAPADPNLLSTYLERCGDSVDDTLVAYLYQSCGYLSEQALTNYVLSGRVTAGTKSRSAAALAAKTGRPFGTTQCRIAHLGHNITCSLAQAYILLTEDPYNTALPVVGAMAANAGLTQTFVCDGRQLPFKKYIKENRSGLSPVSAQLCEDCRLCPRR